METMVTNEKFAIAFTKAMKIYNKTPEMYLSAEGLDRLYSCAEKVLAFLYKKNQVTFDEYLEFFSNALNELEGDGDVEKWASIGARMVWIVNITNIILED